MDFDAIHQTFIQARAVVFYFLLGNNYFSCSPAYSNLHMMDKKKPAYILQVSQIYANTEIEKYRMTT